MKVKRLLDDIEQSPSYRSMPRELRPDRQMLLSWLSVELGELTSKIPDADIFAVRLEPAIVTLAGIREYSMPKDFGVNFLRKDAETWAVMIDDGTTESQLPYKIPTEFYSQNLRAESNGVPACYTIVTTQRARRELVLSPPPDGEYQIDGLYIPADWDFQDEDDLPPLPANNPILKYAVMRRLSADFEPKYGESWAQLMMELARSRKTQFKPQMAQDSGSGYQIVRWR